MIPSSGQKTLSRFVRRTLRRPTTTSHCLPDFGISTVIQAGRIRVVVERCGNTRKLTR